MAGTWTTERRAAQAARARALKPWTKSTGPKTAAGKAKVAGNAIRTGIHAREFRAYLRDFRTLLRLNRQMVADCKAALRQMKAKAPRTAAKSENKVKPPCWDRGLPGRKPAERRYTHENSENKLKNSQDRDRPDRKPAECWRARQQNAENKLKPPDWHRGLPGRKSGEHRHATPRNMQNKLRQAIGGRTWDSSRTAPSGKT